MADDVDGDGRDAVARQSGGDHVRAVVLVVAEAVTKDRDRPASGGLRARGQEQVEVHPLCGLHGWNTAERADGRNQAFGGLVLGRRVTAEGHAPDRAENPEGAGRDHASRQPGADGVLAIEIDRPDRR